MLLLLIQKILKLTRPCLILVQHECIPQAILGGDLVCQAKSGMGKTAVFVLSTLQLLAGDMAAATNPDRVGPLVLVLAHTRELAYQINKEYQRFSKFLVGIRSEVAFGGLNLKTQIATLAEKPVNKLFAMGLQAFSSTLGCKYPHPFFFREH